jgi:mono/diheme cytochrome c family protein
MSKASKFLLALCLAACGTLIFASEMESSWIASVPAKDRTRANPVEGDPNAVLVGKKLFQQHCASCHGSGAEGKGKRPNLHSETIRNAKPGELQWLLTNGSLKKGMPSWSRLPEQQRWQLVTFLKTLE